MSTGPYTKQKLACSEFLSYLADKLPTGHDRVANEALVKALAIIWSNATDD